MAKISVYGFDEVTRKLEAAVSQEETAAKKAIYGGAAVVADAVKQEIDKLPTDERYGTPMHPVKGIKQVQKDGLKESFGIAPLRNDKGFLNVKLGFDGYNGLKTKRWPKGQPNAMIARAAESGTSFSEKNPFMRNALKSSKAAAKKEMSETFEKEIGKLMK